MSFPKITVREATLADLDAISSLCSAAFDKDAFFNLFCPPELRALYPTAMPRWFWRRTRRRMLDSTKVCLVAEIQLTSGSPKQIAGYACWQRILGVNPPPYVLEWRDRRDTLLKRMERSIIEVEDRMAQALTSDKAMLVEVEQRYDNMIKAVEKEFFPPPKKDGRWWLIVLGVRPDFQRLGVGRKLVRWGCQRADEEGVCCALEASKCGAGLYLSEGFIELKEVGILGQNGEKSIMKIMKRDPRGRDENGEVVELNGVENVM